MAFEFEALAFAFFVKPFEFLYFFGGEIDVEFFFHLSFNTFMPRRYIEAEQQLQCRTYSARMFSKSSMRFCSFTPKPLPYRTSARNS